MTNPDQEKERLQNIQELLEETDDTITPPDTSNIFNQYIEPEHATVNDDNVCINGQWVHPFFLRIINMLAKGKSPIIFVVGKEGLGKSMAAVWISHVLHDKINALQGSFTPDEQVVYDVIPFLLLYLNSKRRVVFNDEANETLNKIDYMDDFNTSVAKTIRTQRIRQNVNLFVGPEFYELDPRVRRKADVIIELKREQWASVTVYKLVHGRKQEKKEYEFQSLPMWQVPDVPDNIQQAYEQIDRRKKQEILVNELRRRVQDRIQELEEQDKKSASI